MNVIGSVLLDTSIAVGYFRQDPDLEKKSIMSMTFIFPWSPWVNSSMASKNPHIKREH